MPKAEKVQRVAELKERIEGADALLLTEYRGLTVSEITELRRSLREGGTRFAVVKNTLMQRAASDAGLTELAEVLSGPSAVAFVSGDVVAAAKAIRAASKQHPSLSFKGGFMDGQLLDASQATGLADLVSREEMLSQIAGVLKSDMAKAARLFQSAQSKFLALLEAYKEKLPSADETVSVSDSSATVAHTETSAEAEATATAEAEATGDEPSDGTTADDTTSSEGNETGTEKE